MTQTDPSVPASDPARGRRPDLLLAPGSGEGVSPELALLREEEPVARIRERTWLVTRHDDVRAGLLDPRLVTHGEQPPPPPVALLDQEPGPHARSRRLAAPALTRARLGRHRPVLAARARDLLRAAAAEPVTDLMAAFARPFSFASLVEVFGVAPGHRDALYPALVVVFDRSEHPAADVRAAAGIVEDTVRAELARRGGDSGDILGVIAENAGDTAEAVSLAVTLLLGGFDSTAQMIGLAAVTLLTHPGLRACEAGLGEVVEELLRWDSPGPFSTPRRATEDLDIGGVTIPKGGRVILALGAANRDPGRHADPERLDPDRFCPAAGGRKGPRHLTFGSGMHACPGAALARLELTIALRELLIGYPDARLTVAPAQLRRVGTLHRRLAGLPVALAG